MASRRVFESGLQKMAARLLNQQKKLRTYERDYKGQRKFLSVVPYIDSQCACIFRRFDCMIRTVRFALTDTWFKNLKMFKNAVMTFWKCPKEILCAILKSNAIHVGRDIGVVLIIAIN